MTRLCHLARNLAAAVCMAVVVRLGRVLEDAIWEGE